ncbi:uncharacterized protein ankrd50l [Eucyclogobius newberryi]|uniref:uncharacterized protein ankrd50l n=1 Tax=Eucyclogobius newberryi TaxID=166745 RepID=UPI003B5BA606
MTNPEARGVSSSLLEGRRFYCREWALEKLRCCLDARLTAGRAPGVLLTGGPGAGKTALCTEALWPTSKAGAASGLSRRCLAFHFCHREEWSSAVTWRFVLALAEQLRTSEAVGAGYEEILANPDVAGVLEPSVCQKDPEEAFKRAVLGPLLELPAPARPLFLLVDALDLCPPGQNGAPPGAQASQRASIAELLASHVHLLPGWLLLVCSARRQNKALCKMFSGFRRICLDDLRKPSPVHDVQQYILCRLDQDPALRRQLSPDTADMLNLLHIKSGGCFLFLQRVLDGVAASLVSLREIRDIPGTLNGLYLWLCQRLFPRGLFTYIRPVLNVLLAAATPLTPQEIFRAVWTQNTSLSFQEFQNKLRTLSSLLIDGPNGAKLLFHASFAEWLLDVKYCTQKYLCSCKEGHTMLAMALTLHGAHLSSEDVYELALHLTNSGQHKNNPSFLALWMLWTDIPRLNASTSVLASNLAGEDVKHLLNISGLLQSDSHLGLETLQEEMVNIKRAFERELSVKKLLDSGVAVNQRNSTDGRTLLANSAIEGSESIAEFLLKHGADPLVSDKQGQTPLTLASRQGHVQVLKVLLDWAKKQENETAARMMEQVDVEGWTALRSGAWGGHIEAVRLLLDARADVDGCDGEGRTALRAAAWGGHEEIVRILLEYGADFDKADCNGRTPLIAAAYMGHQETVEILLDHGAQVNFADGDGRTALSVAALCVPTAAGVKGYGEVASLLLERGANPGHRDKDGMTPLLLAAYEGNQDVVELLLEAGADVDETAGPDGDLQSAAAVTPLLAAASMGHMGTVSKLLFWGADVDAIDSEGRTALCLAAARGSVEVVRALLDRGLDENHKDDLGWTPLHAAACEGHKTVCGVLMEQGSMARVGEMDIEGRTSLILAAQEGHVSTVRLLLDRRCPIDHRAYDGHSALTAALLEEQTEVAELLMRRGADTDVRDAEGRPLLYLLVLEGRLEMATLLLEKGGVPLESKDAEGRTALHVACWQGSAEMVNLLLKHSANPNAQDAEGRPSLHSAAWTGHSQVGRTLLETPGTDIDLCCNQGATALSIAAQVGHVNIVAMLLDKGANPEHVDKYNRTPVKVAAKHGHANVIRLLERYGAKPYIGPRSRTVSPIKPSSSATPLRNGAENRADLASAGGATSSSSLSSPASTAERFHSMQSSQTSSTCHSLATVQTVPADSISFVQQIQQHSLPRARSRPSTLPHGSTLGSLHGSTKWRLNDSPPPTICTVNAIVHQSEQPKKSVDYQKMRRENTKTSSAGGKWHSVMTSLGIMPGQDSPIANMDAPPPIGYPYRTAWDDVPEKDVKNPSRYSFSPQSAYTDELTISTKDPHLNLKQAIKLQFEGPTSAAPYKRETPL